MNNNEKINYVIACMELNTILNILPTQEKEKIPQEFLKEIKKYKLKNYVFKYDYSKPLEQQKLNDVTREMLYIIYRDYLCETPQILEEKIKILSDTVKVFDLKNIDIGEFLKRLNK